MNRFTSEFGDHATAIESSILAKCTSLHNLEETIKNKLPDVKFDKTIIIDYTIKDLLYLPEYYSKRLIKFGKNVIDSWYLNLAIEDFRQVRMVKVNGFEMRKGAIGKKYSLEFRYDKDHNYPCAFKVKKNSNTWYIIAPCFEGDV